MDKRHFLIGAAVLSASAARASSEQNAPDRANATSPAILTVTGAIKRNNRGPLNPALDQLLAKQQVKFSQAFTFDFPSIAGLPAITIRPTIEYDARQHTLSGPLLIDLLEYVGAPRVGGTKLLLRAIDGYSVTTTIDNVRDYRFIVATHLNGKPMALGGLGPLWAVYDADSFPDLAEKSLEDRFALCPWGLYQIQVIEA